MCIQNKDAAGKKGEREGGGAGTPSSSVRGPHAGDQPEARLSMQTAPSAQSMLGWNILVSKCIEGAFMGYSPGKTSLTLKHPPSYGESFGPKSVTDQINGSSAAAAEWEGCS